MAQFDADLLDNLVEIDNRRSMDNGEYELYSGMILEFQQNLATSLLDKL